MQRIGFIALPGFRMMSLASLSVFELANGEMDQPVYDLHLLSDAGGLVRSSIGIPLMTEPLDGRRFDTVIVGGSAQPGALTPGVIKFLQRAVRRSRRVAATCTGAFVLAEAGLLDGRRATTHWASADQLAERYPAIDVDPRVLYVDNGDILTSAGSAACLDLCLHVVRRDFGADVAP